MTKGENNMYAVYHVYDVDGGFGDAVERDDMIAIFPTEELAKAYVAKWNNPHVYAVPYQELQCGLLEVRILPPMMNEKDIDRSPWAFDPENNRYENCDKAYDPFSDDDDEDEV